MLQYELTPVLTRLRGDQALIVRLLWFLIPERRLRIEEPDDRIVECGVSTAAQAHGSDADASPTAMLWHVLSEPHHLIFLGRRRGVRYAVALRDPGGMSLSSAQFAPGKTSAGFAEGARFRFDPASGREPPSSGSQAKAIAKKHGRAIVL